MNNKTTVEDLANAFYQKGERCDYGCDENNLDTLWSKVVKMAGGNRNVYAVKDWIWYDVIIDGNKLAVVKANYVLLTNNRNFDVGDWVRTSPINNFTENCICETSNSYYILVGDGSRKKSDESIFSFFG